jgi:dephospho-CoA kinase
VLLVGLTGGIGTGKNTAANLFKELGATIIDADVLSRELVKEGMPALKEISDAFGPNVIREDGSLDRKVLGEIIFADDKKRSLLNSILHPRIIEEEVRRISIIKKEAPESIVIVNAALLIESGNYKDMDVVIVVSADEDIIIRRLEHRDDLSKEESLLRIRAQSSTSKKLKYADFVLENNNTIKELKTNALGIYEKLKKLE